MCETPAHYGAPNLLDQEKHLYSHFIDYVHSGFYELKKPKHGSLRLIPEITAQRPAPDGGQWTRPDVAAVAVSRRKFASAGSVHILSFEIKTANSGADLSSVHEALAHARFANFAYLVWNRPFCTCGDDRYSQILKNCSLYDIGLITVHNPKDIRTYDVRLEAKRSDVTEDALDDFIASRFSEENQALVLDALREMCAEPL